MPEKESSNKKLTILGVILVIIIVLIGAAVLVLVSPNVGKTEKKLSLTTSFSNITAEEAYNIIKNNLNADIIYYPGCTCPSKIQHFYEVHIGDPPSFEAILLTNTSVLPKGIQSLYNTTNITIFYDDNGNGDALLQGRKLVNNSYAAIYYIDGGLAAWRAKNYPVVGTTVN